MNREENCYREAVCPRGVKTKARRKTATCPVRSIMKSIA